MNVQYTPPPAAAGGGDLLRAREQQWGVRGRGVKALALVWSIPISVYASRSIPISKAGACYLL